MSIRWWPFGRRRKRLPLLRLVRREPDNVFALRYHTKRVCDRCGDVVVTVDCQSVAPRLTVHYGCEGATMDENQRAQRKAFESRITRAS
jgi:hypothetical protein